MTADDYALGIRNGWLAGKAPRGSRFEQNSRDRSIITSAGSPARRLPDLSRMRSPYDRTFMSVMPYVSSRNCLPTYPASTLA
jgi:hypothetical protein